MLSTTFRNPRVASSNSALTDQQLRQVAPSIFAPVAHGSRSERYTYVPTIDVVSALRKEGFEPFYAAQSRTRDDGRREFTKHMLRLRQGDQISGRAGEVPEVVLINSHDGSSGYQMLAGMFRFACCNGLVVGNQIEDVRVRHSGDVIGEVIEGVYRVVDEFDRVESAAGTMKALTLSEGESQAFARAALVAKYGPSETGAFPVTERQILQPKRAEDVGQDLWRVFNRTQENLVGGGVRGRASSGRRIRTRAVTGISENVGLNRALWTLAEEMAKLKSTH